jgi:spoIIIJ-associated protein
MIKIEAITLEEAYSNAALKLECSITELQIEVVQTPSSGFLGLFKKKAIIVAVPKLKEEPAIKETPKVQKVKKPEPKVETKKTNTKAKEVKERKKEKPAKKKQEHKVINDTIMPESFVSTQDDEDYDMEDINFTADYEDEEEIQEVVAQDTTNADEVAITIEKEVNELFNLTCFNIDKIEVSAYDAQTLLVEFKGEDAALLIGKEGYRYKALSYMIFNWINTKYKLQLRLEIAEFLKNQEESVARYLVGVCENVDRDGRAQTKILDGVLVQIALKELRDKYPNKYVAIRSTRDGLKFIIINEYNNY